MPRAFAQQLAPASDAGRRAERRIHEHDSRRWQIAAGYLVWHIQSVAQHCVGEYGLQQRITLRVIFVNQHACAAGFGYRCQNARAGAGFQHYVIRSDACHLHQRQRNRRMRAELTMLNLPRRTQSRPAETLPFNLGQRLIRLGQSAPGLGCLRRIFRFTPTCVGNTQGPQRRTTCSTVHPHVRGEYAGHGNLR